MQDLSRLIIHAIVYSFQHAFYDACYLVYFHTFYFILYYTPSFSYFHYRSVSVTSGNHSQELHKIFFPICFFAGWHWRRPAQRPRHPPPSPSASQSSTLVWTHPCVKSASVWTCPSLTLSAQDVGRFSATPQHLSQRSLLSCDSGRHRHSRVWNCWWKRCSVMLGILFNLLIKIGVTASMKDCLHEISLMVDYSQAWDSADNFLKSGCIESLLVSMLC